VSEIPELVQLSKETGRIQFTLNTNPTHYEGMDYLDPIFSELKPPMLTMPSNIYTSDDNYDEWQNEFRDFQLTHSSICMKTIPCQDKRSFKSCPS
jgi:hypothetical protein